MTHFAGASTTNFGGASPTGNFTPELYSKNVLLALRRNSVADMITNNEYYGEISAYGDTVHIVKEPDVSVKDYTRNLTTTSDALVDNELVLKVDQAKYYQFEVNDIERKISHIDWESRATNRAAYKLMQSYDTAILDFMADSTNMLAANVVNDQAEANVLDMTDPDDLLNQITDLSIRLSLADNTDEGRFLILPHTATQVLSQIDSKLLSADFNGGAMNLKDNPHYKGMLRGFHVYITNNAPTYTSTGTGAADRNVMLAGQLSAVATAQTILNTEKMRSERTFGDIVRGLHVYGRGVGSTRIRSWRSTS